MAGVLSVGQWLGGPDEIQAESIFPSNQKTVVYNFNTDITGWTFATDYQTIVVDQVQFSRSNQPNFTESKVIGYFPKEEVQTPFAPEVVNAAEGTVKIHFPANMYSGAIIPDARTNVTITIFSVTWTDGNTPPQTMSHRWSLLNSWEPDVAIGSPTDDPDYTAIGA